MQEVAKKIFTCFRKKKEKKEREKMKILGMKFGNDLGSQIGKTSKSGLQTFVKTNKNGQKFFTTVNAKTKDVVRTKRFTPSQSARSTVTRIDTFDKSGNLVSSSDRYERGIGFGPSSANKFSKIIRRHFEKFNRFGQTIGCSRTTVTPKLDFPRLIVDKDVNGRISRTYVNTIPFPTKTIRTIDCVE